MSDINNLFCALLHRALHFNNRRYKALVTAMGGADRVLSASGRELAGLVTAEEMTAIKAAGECNSQATILAGQLTSCGASIIAMDSPEYPQELHNIFNPPAVLYVRGQLPSGRKIAIVGSRNPTAYGKNAVKKLAGELAVAGVVIVSGAARGIDTAAHLAALEAGQPTIAVLGCGIDKCYPAENKDLLNKITQNGAVVSEYPPGVDSRPYFFPMRNRIISGLSEMVIVAEAAGRSGALITADFALDQGKDVGAVPGSIFSENSAGCHKLIKNGARLVDDAADLLQDLQLPLFETKSGKQVVPVFSDEREAKVYNAVPRDYAVSVDDICALTGYDARSVNVALFNMLMRGIICEEAGKRYIHA